MPYHSSRQMLWPIAFIFFKQKTAYEMRISGWSSDVCSSDLPAIRVFMDHHVSLMAGYLGNDRMAKKTQSVGRPATPFPGDVEALLQELYGALEAFNSTPKEGLENRSAYQVWQGAVDGGWRPERSEEHTSELQSLMRISYA